MSHDDNRNRGAGPGHYLGLVLPAGVDLVGLSRLVGLVVLLILAWQQLPRMTPDQVTYLLLGLSTGLGLRGGGGNESTGSPLALRAGQSQGQRARELGHEPCATCAPGSRAAAAAPTVRAEPAESSTTAPGGDHHD